ncbi:MAG: hypothetical protein Q8P18_23000 [Pseudomonadota bacterium]|nr:hypothetical protein [Pseudomonadota bacterium]
MFRSRLYSFVRWLVALVCAMLLHVYLTDTTTALRVRKEASAWQAADDVLAEASSTLTAEMDVRAQVAQAIASRVQAGMATAESPAALEALVDGSLQAAASAAGAPEAGAYLTPIDGARYARRFRSAPDGSLGHVDEAETYTRPGNDAWHVPLTDGEGWLTFTGDAEEGWFAQYSVPIYRPAADVDAVAVGVVFVRYPWDAIESSVSALHLGETGYAFVITPSGELVGHPRAGRSAAGLTVSALAKRLEDPHLSVVGDRAHRGEDAFIDRLDPSSKQLERLSFAPLASSGWSVVAVAAHRETVRTEVSEQRAALHISGCGLLVAYLAMGAAVSLLGLSRGWLIWVHAIAWTGTMLLGTTLLWVSGVGALDDPTDGVRITDISGLNHYLDRKEQEMFPALEAESTATAAAATSIVHGASMAAVPSSTALPAAEAGAASRPGEVGRIIQIPTGVFLQSLEFASANNAMVTGVAWQRFPLDVPEGLEPGLIFPEAVGDSSIEAHDPRPIFTAGVKTGMLYRYSFALTLRERFDFRRYPFDTKDVWLRMWPKAFDENVVLVPDLGAYTFIDPARLPGLDLEFVPAGWRPLRTYFQYREVSYSTDFGNRAYAGTESFPELNFTLDVRRAFVSTFVSELIPLLVVACLLFGVLRTLTSDVGRIDLTGFNFTNVLGACSGLVFVIVLGHIQLRTALAGQAITYLEWYYFILYVLLVLIGVDAWMVISPQPWKIIAWGDNLLARLAFWPALTTAVFVATMAYFYPQAPSVRGAGEPTEVVSDPG